MPVWPHETDAQLLDIIKQTLINWRKQGLAGHWTYDKGRHANLLAFYEALNRGR
jgi:hypothetical protein